MKNIRKMEDLGITLVALVVTIIVLLILAGVTINMALGNNGLIVKTKMTKEEIRGASVEEERDMWKLGQEAGDNKSMETLLEEIGPNGKNLLSQNEIDQIIGNEERGIKPTGKVTIGSRTIEFKEKYDYLRNYAKIGDWVEYVPDGEDEYIVRTDYSGYSAVNEYTLRKENFKWRVFNINENGKVILISDNSSNSTFHIYEENYNIPFAYNAYNNVVYLLNDVCNSLYSNINYGTARSINLEDITHFINQDVIDTIKNENKYGSSRYSIHDNERTYPIICLKEESFEIDEIRGDEYQQSQQDEIITGYAQTNSNVKLYSTELRIDCNNHFNNSSIKEVLDSDKNYWIATRGTKVTSNYFMYGCYYYFPYYKSIELANVLNRSNCSTVVPTHLKNNSYRPIVELNNDVKARKSGDTWILEGNEE
ncbi:MAG: hypothetical protein IKG56_04080 [Clostridia bacterium]|nr:hypothetical protein [Clostridia bacterium]